MSEKQGDIKFVHRLQQEIHKRKFVTVLLNNIYLLLNSYKFTTPIPFIRCIRKLTTYQFVYENVAANLLRPLIKLQLKHLLVCHSLEDWKHCCQSYYKHSLRYHIFLYLQTNEWIVCNHREANNRDYTERKVVNYQLVAGGFAMSGGEICNYCCSESKHNS